MLELIVQDSATFHDFRQGVPNRSTLKNVRPGGRIVNGARNKLWVERFDGSGEFSVSGPVSSDLFSQLPLKSIVTHTNTQDLMVVHSHLIEGNSLGEPVMKVQGSQLVSYFLGGRRFMDAEIPRFPMSNSLTEPRKLIIGDPNISPGQIPPATLMSKEVVSQLLRTSVSYAGSNNFLDSYRIGVWMNPYPPGASDADYMPAARKFVGTHEIGMEKDIYSALSDIMDDFDLGILVRRNVFDDGATPYDILMTVSGGINLTGEDGVHFKVGSNSVKRYSSLASCKDTRNAAYVTTSHFEFMILDGKMETLEEPVFGLNIINIDCSVVDEGYDLGQAEMDKSNILNAAYGLAKTELTRNNTDEFIVEVDVNSDNPEYQYRRDFNLGDVVTIDSSAFFKAQNIRVVEYVETEDNGKYEGHPVLRALKPGWDFNVNNKQRNGPDFPDPGPTIM